MTQSDQQTPGLLTIVWSVLAAMFGVQTEANRKRDFSQKNPIPYIVVGVLFIVLFVFTIAGIVRFVINNVGG